MGNYIIINQNEGFDGCASVFKKEDSQTLLGYSEKLPDGNFECYQFEEYWCEEDEGVRGKSKLLKSGLSADEAIDFLKEHFGVEEVKNEKR